MLINLCEDSPLRPPDWRWLRVNVYRDASRTMPRSRRDRLTNHLIRFLNDWHACRDQFDKDDLKVEYEELAVAHNMYSCETGASSKWELESRLLANEETSSICSKLSLRPETVDIYEKVFFNVKDRLQNRSWIINCVIGRSIHVGLTDRDFDLLWKMYGLFSGKFMLDLVTGKLGLKMQHAGSEAEALSMMREANEAQATMRASTALAVTPINGFTAAPMIQVEQAYRQIAKDAAGVESTQVIMQKVNGVLSGLPWSVGAGTIKHPVLDIMGSADSLAAELRVQEMIGVANGDNLLDIKTLRLPEPEETHGN